MKTSPVSLPGSHKAGWVVRWEPVSGHPPTLFVSGSAERRLSHFRAGDGAFSVLDGYLFDRPKSPCFATQAQQAYEEQGSALFPSLRGGFALVLWEPKHQRLHFVRDATGVRTCFYAWRGGTLLLSSSIKALLSQAEVVGTWNRTLIAEHLLSRYTLAQQCETHYQELHRLPPGHFLTLDRQRLSITRYWDPLPEGFAWASRAESAALPRYLERAVQRCLSVGADSISLSGGFDSVSLATLAAEHRDKSKRLHAISLHVDAPECDEKTAQVAVAEALRMPQIIRSIREVTPGNNCIEAALALSRTSPGPVLSPWQGMYSGLFEMAQEAGLQDVMMGTGGDEIFSVDPSYSIDLLRTGRFVALWQFLQMWRRASPFSTQVVTKAVLWNHALRPLVQDWKMRCLASAPSALVEPYQRRRGRTPFPDWFSAGDSALTGELAMRQTQREAGPRTASLRTYARTIRALPLAPQLLFELDQGMAWAQSYGFTMLYPFFDQDLFALALRTKPAELTQGGWSKAPLRELVARRLPSVTLPVKKVDFTLMLHRILRKYGALAWQNMGRLSSLEGLGLIHHERTAKHVDDYFQGRTNNWHLPWSVMSTESWLRADRGRIDDR